MTASGRNLPLEFGLGAPVERPVSIIAAMRSLTTLVTRNATFGNNTSKA